jgi:arylesterase/paraoxonase
LNDVAPIGPDSFYATNLIFFHNSFLKYFELFLSLSLSNTVLYDNGVARVVANALLMNGINFSPDKK